LWPQEGMVLVGVTVLFTGTAASRSDTSISCPQGPTGDVNVQFKNWLFVSI